MVDDVDDRVLVRAAQSGDLDAFEVLLRRHQTPVYRVALRMLRSEADAQDASQEAFVQAWKSLDRFRGDSSFATWMYRIITNRSLNLIARRRAAAFYGVARVVEGSLDLGELQARLQGGVDNTPPAATRPRVH